MDLAEVIGTIVVFLMIACASGLLVLCLGWYLSLKE